MQVPTVGELMTTEIVAVTSETSVGEAVSRMRDARVGAVAVVDDDELLCGIFTERDLMIRVVAAGLDAQGTRVGEVMTPHPKTVDADTPLAVVWPRINDWGFRHIPIESQGRLAGILSLRDIFRVRLWHVESRLNQELRTLQQIKSLLDLESDERAKELIQINARLSELALTDDLTGLYNHRYLKQRLQEEVSRSRRYGLALSLLFVDIDRFKEINDAFGHAAGDQVLRRLARLLRTTVGGSVLARIRRYDVVARYGGEEFALLLPITDTGAAMVVAERVRAAVEGTAVQLDGGKTVQLTVSIGVATLPDHGTDEEGLLGAADEALYLAKNAGRNRVAKALLDHHLD